MKSLHPLTLFRVSNQLNLNERQTVVLVLAAEYGHVDFALLGQLIPEWPEPSVSNMLRNLSSLGYIEAAGRVKALGSGRRGSRPVIWKLTDHYADLVSELVEAASTNLQGEQAGAKHGLERRVHSMEAPTPHSEVRKKHSMTLPLPESFPSGCVITVSLGQSTQQRTNQVKSKAPPISLAVYFRRKGHKQQTLLAKRPIWRITDRLFRDLQMIMVANAISDNLDARELSPTEIAEYLRHKEVAPKWRTTNDVLAEIAPIVEEQLPGNWEKSRLFEKRDPFRVRVEPPAVSDEAPLFLQGSDFENPEWTLPLLASWFAQWCDKRESFRGLYIKMRG